MWWNAERILPALLPALLLLSQPAPAARYYKYQDENGIWHFTDQKPETDRPVEERRVRVDPTPIVEVESHRLPTGFELEADIHLHGPVSLWLSFAGSRNLVLPAMEQPLRLLGPGKVSLWQIGVDDPQQSGQLSLAYRALPGWPMDDPTAEQLLQLPFPADRRFRISQAFHGDRSHTDGQNAFAVDIVMPAGTPVLAARDGVVMEAESDFQGSGQRSYHLDRANRVRLLHEDGSMTVYAHLAFEQVMVKPGQTVLAGELLGYSGASGYSSGPHLHFVVQGVVDDRLTSLPFRFITADGDLQQPETGQWLPRQPLRFPPP